MSKTLILLKKIIKEEIYNIKEADTTGSYRFSISSDRMKTKFKASPFYKRCKIDRNIFILPSKLTEAFEEWADNLDFIIDDDYTVL